MPKIIATIEARMNSTRLPGKVLLPAGGKPLLAHLVQRLKKIDQLEEIVLATTTDESNDLLEDFSQQYQISHFRGSEEDVMGRVVGAAQSVRGEVIVEITGDCPLIDPNLVAQCIEFYLKHDYDYVSNCHEKQFPLGMETQVFSLETLEKSYSMTDDPLDREHVTIHIKKHPEIFKQIQVPTPPLYHRPEISVTLDEPHDYELIKKIVDHFGSENSYFTCLDIINLIDLKPEWRQINQNVKRKGWN